MTSVDKLIELTALQTTNTLEKLDYKSNFASVIIINILLILFLIPTISICFDQFTGKVISLSPVCAIASVAKLTSCFGLVIRIGVIKL